MPQLIALGVNGGPRLSAGNPKPALALRVADAVYLVDAGYETALQFVSTGLSFANLRQIFITHNHLDHTSGLPGVFIHGWVAQNGLKPNVGIWGPSPTDRFVKGFEVMFGEDIANYEAGGGFGGFPMPVAHDVVLGSEQSVFVFEDEHVIVSATKVFHGAEMENSLAYRFDLRESGISVVFSGDTGAMDENLISLARDCDYLVHEVQDNTAVEKVVATIPDPVRGAQLGEHLLTSHTSIEDIPKVAATANAKNLLLSHYTPFPQPAEVFRVKVEASARVVGYQGNIIAPSAGDFIELHIAGIEE